MPKKTIALILNLLLLPAYAGARDIYDLNIQARDLATGRAVSLLPELPMRGNTTTGSSACTKLSTSQARLAYDQYAYQLFAAVPAAGVLTFRFDQIITQNSTYGRLLYNADGTPIIDPVTNQQAWELTYDTQIDSLFGIGYGLDLIGGLKISVEGVAVNRKIGEDFAWGFDGNAQLIYADYADASADYADSSADDSPLPPLQNNGSQDRQIEPPKTSLGVILKDINAKYYAWHVPYREVRDRPSLEVFGSYLIESMDLNLSASLEQRLEWDALAKGKGGLEYVGFKPLTLRLAWDADHINVGAGFEVALGEAKDNAMVIVDYAAITSGALYDANRISISILF